MKSQRLCTRNYVVNFFYCSQCEEKLGLLVERKIISVCSHWSFIRTHKVTKIMLTYLIALNVKRNSAFFVKENRFLFILILQKVTWSHKDYADKVFECSQWEKKFGLFCKRKINDDHFILSMDSQTCNTFFCG